MTTSQPEHRCYLIRPAGRPNVHAVRCTECGRISTPHLKIDARDIADRHEREARHQRDYLGAWQDRANAEQARSTWVDLITVGNRVTHAWWRENVDLIPNHPLHMA